MYYMKTFLFTASLSLYKESKNWITVRYGDIRTVTLFVLAKQKVVLLLDIFLCQTGLFSGEEKGECIYLFTLSVTL